MDGEMRRMARHVKVLAYIGLVLALLSLAAAVSNFFPKPVPDGVYVPRGLLAANPKMGFMMISVFVLPSLCVFVG